MRTHVRLPRPQRTARLARKLPRPIAPVRNVVRSKLPTVKRNISARTIPASNWSGFQPDPYVDYGRFLTAEGGILFIYKDLDLRWRHVLWRIFAWASSTGGEGWYLFHHSPLHSLWLNLACLAAIGVVNWLIVMKPVRWGGGKHLAPRRGANYGKATPCLGFA